MNETFLLLMQDRPITLLILRLSTFTVGGVMTSRITRGAATSALAVSVLLGSGLSVAQASPLQSDAPDPSTGGSYSDSEIVSLLVLGAGRAAQEHPDLGNKFTPRAADDVPEATDQQVQALTNALVDVVPNFHDTVTLGVQKQDPFAAQAAMTALGQGLRTVASREKNAAPSSDVVSTQGFAWHDANVFTEINGVAVLNVAGYANGAVVTEVAWVLYVTPGAISYEFPTTANTLDSQNIVAQLATEL